MGHDRQGLLRQLEDRLTRVSSLLAARHRAPERPHARIEALRRDFSRARQAATQVRHDALARARATLEDMAGDYEIAPPRTALRREELEALRRHLQRAAQLLPHLSNLDDPRWGWAREEYERSWYEVERAFEAEGGAATR